MSEKSLFEKKPEECEYSFVQHKKCEFFPCHKTEHPENFNCLFCFCPLYALGRRCGGNFQYTDSGIKDCSDCLFPHRRENYDRVLARYEDILALIRETDKDTRSSNSNPRAR